MLENTPTFIAILFGATVLITINWLYIASRSKTFLVVALIWTALQSALGLSGIYQDTESIPPKLVLFGVLPAIVCIVVMFLTSRGKKFIDDINLKTLTYFHTIRIPVEVVLALLFHQGLVSVYMTFEGTNFDIISGLTAPIVAYLAFRGPNVNRKLLMAWNIICLLLLLNVVITAIFAIPSPFQKLSLDQPNVAVLYFPFNLLPSVVVPLVLFGHLVAFRRLGAKD